MGGAGHLGGSCLRSVFLGRNECVQKRNTNRNPVYNNVNVRSVKDKVQEKLGRYRGSKGKDATPSQDGLSLRKGESETQSAIHDQNREGRHRRQGEVASESGWPCGIDRRRPCDITKPGQQRGGTVPVGESPIKAKGRGHKFTEPRDSTESQGHHCKTTEPPGHKPEKVDEWIGLTGPPAVPGTKLPNGAVLPRTTIQPGLLRGAPTLQEKLTPHEAPILSELSPDRPAFVRAAIERSRAILFVLADSGNLVQEDVISLKTFNELNKHARPPFSLEPFQGNIYAVNGHPLQSEGVVKGGMLLHFEGATQPIRVSPVVCSDFKGNHLNLCQRTMGDKKISYHPTAEGGSWKLPGGEAVPLVIKRPPLYSPKYKDDVLKRVSIWRLKQGFLQRKAGQSERKPRVSEREGLEALMTENQILRAASKNQPVILTSDGYLARGGTPANDLNRGTFSPSPSAINRGNAVVLEDAFVGHEDLRGLSVEELSRTFGGEDAEVAHLKHLPEGRPMFLSPQIGRLARDVDLASGEARTVVVRTTLPTNSYVVAEPLYEEDEPPPEHLRGCVLSPSLTLCFNGKTAVVVLTNNSFGPVSLKANTPLCSLRVVRPEYERQVLHEQQTSGEDEETETVGEIARRAPAPDEVLELLEEHLEDGGEVGSGLPPPLEDVEGSDDDEEMETIPPLVEMEELNGGDLGGGADLSWGSISSAREVYTLDEELSDPSSRLQASLACSPSPGQILGVETLAHGEGLVYSGNDHDHPEMMTNADPLFFMPGTNCPYHDDEPVYWSSESEDGGEEVAGDRVCGGMEGGKTGQKPKRGQKGKPSLEMAMQSPWTAERWRFGRLVEGSSDESEDETEAPPSPILDLAQLSPKERKEHLARELKLDQNPILAASPGHLEELKALVARYHHIFTDGKSYNHVNLPACPYVQCRVILDPNKGPHTPYRATPRTMSPIQRKALRDKIEQWRLQGVIEPSASPWSFPLIAVEKKRRPGQQFPEYRYCVDLRVLNDICLKDSCFSGSVPANLALLEGHNFYASLDLFSSFESVEIAPESRDFFSFSGADGEHWRMKRMSQGFCNSPGVMSRVTSMILQGLPTSSRQAEVDLGLEDGTGVIPAKLKGGGALGYIDDLLVFNQTLEGLLCWLEEIFARISRAKCLVKCSKAFLVQEEVEYLGFIVGKGGRKMQPSYRESVVNWPIPTTRAALSSFIGRTSYYREFITNFSHLTHSLNQAKTRPESGWKISKEEADDFRALQDAFTKSEALTFPNFEDLNNNPFILDLDFSQKGLSASLHQRQKCDDGEWREKLIGNISRKAPSPLATSSSHRGEIAAAIMGVQHFRHLLLLAEFVLRSDSLSVRFIKNLKDLRGCFPRYYELLAQFRFRAVHRAGHLNTHDDQMSRATHILPDMTEEELDVHMLPTVGGMGGKWTGPQAETVAGWEHQEGRAWTRVNTTPAAQSLSRWDPKRVDVTSQRWESHPRLGYLNQLRLDAEEEEVDEDEVGNEEGAEGVKEGDNMGLKDGHPAWESTTQSSSTRLAPSSLYANAGSIAASGDKTQPWVAGLSVNDLVDLQRRDANLSIVRRWVRDKVAPDRKQMRQGRADRELWCYRQMFPLISLEGDLLIVGRVRGQMTRSHRLLIPREARLRMVATAHQQYCKHQGPDGTLWALHTGCYWPGQVRDVTDYVSTCGNCWSKKYPPAKHQCFERYTRTAGYVGQMVCADLIGPLPETAEHRFKYCLTALDVFSRFLYLVPIKNKTAEVVATAFEWGVVARCGGVEAVYTDRGKEWLNHTFSKVCDRLGVRHTYTLPYSPSANGALERAHRTIKTMIRACLRAGTSEGWVEIAKGVVAAYNSTTTRSTGLTPFFLMHGRECALPLTHFVTPPPYGSAIKLTPRERWMQIGRQMTLYFLQQRLGLELVQRRVSHQGAGAHPLYPLPKHVGAEVVACLPSLTRKYSKTFAPRFLGPYFVIDVHSNVVATIRSNFYAAQGEQEREYTVGIDRLWPVPKGTRWQDGGLNLPAHPGRSFSEQKEQQWASIDLQAEVLKGAAPDIELAKLGEDPSRLDGLWSLSVDSEDNDVEREEPDALGDEQAGEEEGQREDQGGTSGEGGGGGGGGRSGDGEVVGGQVDEPRQESEVGGGGESATEVTAPRVPEFLDDLPLGGRIVIETNDEREDIQENYDGEKSTRRRRSRSRSVVSIEAYRRTPAPARSRHGSDGSRGRKTPPNAPVGGWQTTPTQGSPKSPLLREEAGHVLRVMDVAVEPDIDIGDGHGAAPADTESGAGPADVGTAAAALVAQPMSAFPAQAALPAGVAGPATGQAALGAETTQPRRKKVPETAGTGRGGQRAQSPAPVLRERGRSVQPDDRPSRLPVREAKIKAQGIFADPEIRKRLWGPPEADKKRKTKKKSEK